MRTSVRGVSGTLLPLRYLAERLTEDAAPLISTRQRSCTPSRFEAWWQQAEATCGPASGLRALFDIVAMPLAAMLGFTATRATFGRDRCHVLLETKDRTPVALMLLHWAARPATLWRDAASAAHDVGASWAFVLAPPFLSLIDARGFATRRALDFALSDIAAGPGFTTLMIIAHADAFDRIPHGRARGARLDALIESGSRYQAQVRQDLQQGVADALGVLSAVVDARPIAGGRRAVVALRPAASHGDPTGEALTLIYRILFLLFAESRHLVPADDPTYRAAYAISGLCREALRTPPRFGLWDALAAASRLSRLGARGVHLTVNAFNGRLFARDAAPSLELGQTRRARRSSVHEDAIRQALVALGSRRGPAGREEISYRDLGVEQLGAVYERVLDEAPAARDATTRATPRHGHSAKRKQTGTFYTPQALADFVVRRTLAPLVAGASTRDILALRVVDPAMGSGAFLIAACRYLATAYAQALIEEGEASAPDLGDDEHAAIRRLIAERCLAGVDRNPVAVQLARLSLWLATLARGKPLGFLDHRLRVGDSLVGAAPEDLSRVGSGKSQSAADLPLFEDSRLERAMRRFARPFGELIDRHDDTVADVKRKEALWQRLSAENSALHPWRAAASLWCARWFWPENAGSVPSAPETRALIDALVRGDRTLTIEHVSARLEAAANAARHHRFFHWPLEFPDVFYEADGSPRANPGFDATLGNPPWEMWRRDEASPRPSGHGSLTRFIRDSGLYPSCDRGHLNLYQPFLERSLTLTRAGGRVGLIVPWGLASDDGAARLRRKLLASTSLDTLVGLDNAAAIFPIHRATRFIVLVASPGQPTRETRARFGVKTTTELDDLPARDDGGSSGAYPVRLTPATIAAVGGPALRIPDVRHRASLVLLERLSSSFPALGDHSSWACRFGRELNATEARRDFGATGLPVIEGKHVSPFQVTPGHQTYIDRATAMKRLPDARFERARLGYRDVAGAANKLSLIAAIIPAGVVTTHTLLCLRSLHSDEQQHFLCALLNSYVLNFVARRLMGGHLTTSLVEGLPAPPWLGDGTDRRIAALARMRTPAVAVQHPASSDSAAELQALVAKRYGLTAPELRHVLSGFPLVPEIDRHRVEQAFEQPGG